MTKKIPFFNYADLYKKNVNAYREIFNDVCSRGAFIMQKDLKKFEKNLEKFLKVKYAIGVADGTNAIINGLLACGVKPGDEVIIASHTYIATAAAIKLVGAKPIFADIGDDFLICPNSVESQITIKTKAVMPTQLNGRCCDMTKILKLAKKHNIDVYEDSAQALGAKFKNKHAGTFGIFGTSSFYPAKLLGSFGDGGAIYTNKEKIYRKCKLFRDHGRDSRGIVVDWGTNSRLDNLQAAFLDFKLKNFKNNIKRRRQIAKMYNNAFKDIENLYLPPGPNSGDHFDVYQNYELAAENRDKLRNFLFSKNISTVIQWNGTPVHQFKKLGFKPSENKHLKKTDWFFKRCLMIPMNISLTDTQINQIIDCIRGFYKKK